MAITVKRKPVFFYPDSKRVIARPFIPGDGDRITSIVKKVVELDDESVRMVLNQVLREFSKRHRNITRVFESNFVNIHEILQAADFKTNHLSKERKLLIGAYFSKEYSIESAAFFNPSMVEDPYQGNLREGELRIVVSFRATGEGHLSSIVFRSGVLDSNNELTFEPAGPMVDVPEAVKRHVYEKESFVRKLHEIGVYEDVVEPVMNRLGDTFIFGELQASIEAELHESKVSRTRREKIETINWVASSHYEITFSMDTAISERVIFPISYAESNGIEDARFVRFTSEEGKVNYYATYTAFNGYTILPKLLETEDFYHFKVLPLHGPQAKHKGMALFAPHLDRRKDHSGTRISMGVRPSRKLRLTSRDRRRLDRDHPRRRPDEAVLAGNDAPGPRRSDEGYRPSSGTTHNQQRQGTRGIRSQRRLLMRLTHSQR